MEKLVKDAFLVSDHKENILSFICQFMIFSEFHTYFLLTLNILPSPEV